MCWAGKLKETLFVLNSNFLQNQYSVEVFSFKIGKWPLTANKKVDARKIVIFEVLDRKIYCKFYL